MLPDGSLLLVQPSKGVLVITFTDFPGFVKQTQQLLENALRNAEKNIPSTTSQKDKETLIKKLRKIDPNYLTNQIIVRTLEDAFQKESMVLERIEDGQAVCVITTSPTSYTRNKIPAPGLKAGNFVIRLPLEPEELAHRAMMIKISDKQVTPTDWHLKVIRDFKNPEELSYELHPFSSYGEPLGELRGAKEQQNRTLQPKKG